VAGSASAAAAAVEEEYAVWAEGGREVRQRCSGRVHRQQGRGEAHVVAIAQRAERLVQPRREGQ